jgi:hypothetical protein
MLSTLEFIIIIIIIIILYITKIKNKIRFKLQRDIVELLAYRM